MDNRASDEVTDFMPSNWTNGRMPHQRIKLIILKNEICNNNLVQTTQLAHIKTWLQHIFGKKKNPMKILKKIDGK